MLLHEMHERNVVYVARQKKWSLRTYRSYQILIKTSTNLVQSVALGAAAHGNYLRMGADIVPAP